eukprot:981087-Pelagomonas_calceolata.AAC.1
MEALCGTSSHGMDAPPGLGDASSPSVGCHRFAWMHHITCMPAAWMHRLAWVMHPARLWGAIARPRCRQKHGWMHRLA